ncbi:hypothetical protein DKK70_15905 [Gilliamella apicola]|uniref:Uncharacterized protein n=1 Tax=Gilliamella apicola TaxID=1196095 RepID=A0A2V4DSZ7_9GAMM|nr:hypothetical protein [Gilliamella apicola]PXZ03702.1 hypothetical protein DKK70_15905 [Gilliamella apicola]
MKNIKKLLLLITLCLPMVSSADCEKWIDQLLEKYHSSRESDMPVCKIWPADESKTIVVLPFPRGSDDSIFYDLDVLLIDTQSGEVIAHNWEPDAFVSDAIQLVGFGIDTARYQLNNESRAFGVRVGFRGSSSVYPFYEQQINLYVQQNEKLNRIVNQLVLKTSGGEMYNCKGEFHNNDAVLLLGNSSTNNFKDLIVSDKEQKGIIKVNSEGECVEEITESTKREYILYYNGVEYPLPEPIY